MPKYTVHRDQAVWERETFTDVEIPANTKHDEISLALEEAIAKERYASLMVRILDDSVEGFSTELTFEKNK